MPAQGRVLPKRPLSAAEWTSRIRRVLLVAHILPAIFGLVAVTLLTRDSDVRAIDIAVWFVVVIWDFFLLTAGWSRIGNIRLAPWVIADALVLSTLVFIGTPARTVVVYAAVEGALFAAVFVSAKIALIQVAIVYGALAAAGIARAMGSDLPSPNTGWLLPLIVTLVGVMALYFLGIALRDLDQTSVKTEAALRERGQLLAQAHREDLEAQSISDLAVSAEERIVELARLTADYRDAIREVPGIDDQRLSLDAIIDEMNLAFDERVATAIEVQRADDLIGMVRRGVADAASARLLRIEVRVEHEEAIVGRQLAPDQSVVVRDIVREATNNAAIHGLGPVTVTVAEADAGYATVDIHDCGDGYDPEQVTPSIGALSTLESAVSIGARLSHHVENPGHRVRLVLPPARAMA